MRKNIVYFAAVLLIVLVLGLLILSNAKKSVSNLEDPKLSPSNANRNVVADTSNIQDATSQEVTPTDESSVSSDSSSGGSGSSSTSNADPIMISDINYSQVSYCGVSNQFDIQDPNLKTSLNEAQRVILECMASSLSSCSNARMQLVSNSGNPDSVYEIKGYENNNCIIQGTDSSFVSKNCSFSSGVINYLFNQAEEEYPLLPSAKFFKIMEIINNDGASVDLGNGNTENVVCL